MRTGCLLLSANMELVVDDEEIARILEDNQAPRLNPFFPRRCVPEQRAGEFPTERRPPHWRSFRWDDPGHARNGETKIRPPGPASGREDRAGDARAMTGK
jgi:hypothetical protein